MEEKLLQEILAQQQDELKHMPFAKWTNREEENLLELDSRTTSHLGHTIHIVNAKEWL